MKKKLFAILLSLTMVVTMMPATAFATNSAEAHTAAVADKATLQKKGDSIIIDLSKTGQSSTSGNVSASTLIDAEKMLKSKQNQYEYLKIILGNSTFELDSKALQAVNNQTRKTPVEFGVVKASQKDLNRKQKDAISELDIYATYDAYIKTNKHRIQEFNGGFIHVTIDLDFNTGKDASKYQVYSVRDDGSMFAFITDVNDGKLHFKTNRLLDYIVLYDAAHLGLKKVFLLEGKCVKNNGIWLKWRKVDGATRYTIYGAKCGEKYQKIKTVYGYKKKLVVRKIKGEKLLPHKVYKFYVVARTPKENRICKTIRIITKNIKDKYANVREIKVNNQRITLKVGNKAKVKATCKMFMNKRHLNRGYGRKLRYYTNNTWVARVTKKGVIKAVNPGEAFILVQDIGGKWDWVKVTVPAKDSADKTDEELFNEYKQEILAKCDSLIKSDSTDAVKKLVSDAKTEISNLKYDSTKSLAENKALLDGAYNKLVSAIEKETGGEDNPPGPTPGPTLEQSQSEALNATSAEAAEALEDASQLNQYAVADVKNAITAIKTSADAAIASAESVSEVNAIKSLVQSKFTAIEELIDDVVSDTEQPNAVLDDLIDAVNSIKDAQSNTDVASAKINGTKSITKTIISGEADKVIASADCLGDASSSATEKIVEIIKVIKTFADSEIDGVAIGKEVDIEKEKSLTEGKFEAICDLIDTFDKLYDSLGENPSKNLVNDLLKELLDVANDIKNANDEDAVESVVSPVVERFEFTAEKNDTKNAISSNADKLILSADSFASASENAKRRLENAIDAIKSAAESELDNITLNEKEKVASAESLAVAKFDAIEEIMQTAEEADELGVGITDEILEIVIAVSEQLKDKATEQDVENTKGDAIEELKQAIYSECTLQAVYTSSDGTLKFYFDKLPHEGDIYNVSPSADSPSDFEYDDIRSDIKKVVIDNSVSKFDGFTSTAYMFYGMTTANEISGAENLDVSNATDMDYMFCSFGSESETLNSVPDVSEWDTESVESMKNMFTNYGFESNELKFDLDLSNWDVTKVSNADNMFKSAGENARAKNWNVTIPEKNGNKPNATDKWYYGNGTNSIAPAAGREFAVSGVVDKNTFKAVYISSDGKHTLTFYYDDIDHSGENITVYENGTDNYLFDNSKEEGEKWGYYEIHEEIKEAVIDSSVSNYHGLTSTAYMFYSMQKANHITGAEYLDVSNVTDMSCMFYFFGYYSLKDNSVPNVSNWNTSNVKNMEDMFMSYASAYSYCANVNAVPDVSNWDTSSVEKMGGMFFQYADSSKILSKIPDVSKWDTSNVREMNGMFGEYGKSSQELTDIPDISNWNILNVSQLGNMFNAYGQSSTKLHFNLDLSSWNIENVDYAGYMFSGLGGVDTNPSTVVIPRMTGDKENSGDAWYYGNRGQRKIEIDSKVKFQLAGITYKDQGDKAFSGKHDEGYPTSFASGEATVLKGAKKTGYDFIGWYEDSACATQRITEIPADRTTPITLYAKWEAEKTIAKLLQMAYSFSESENWNIVPEDADIWKDSTGNKKCYASFDDTVSNKKPNVLVINSGDNYYIIRANAKTSKNNDVYTFEDNDYIVEFNTVNGKLDSIKVEGKADDPKNINGKYEMSALTKAQYVALDEISASAANATTSAEGINTTSDDAITTIKNIINEIKSSADAKVSSAEGVTDVTAAKELAVMKLDAIGQMIDAAGDEPTDEILEMLVDSVEQIGDAATKDAVNNVINENKGTIELLSTKNTANKEVSAAAAKAITSAEGINTASDNAITTIKEVINEIKSSADAKVSLAGDVSEVNNIKELAVKKLDTIRQLTDAAGDEPTDEILETLIDAAEQVRDAETESEVETVLDATKTEIALLIAKNKAKKEVSAAADKTIASAEGFATTSENAQAKIKGIISDIKTSADAAIEAADEVENITTPKESAERKLGAVEGLLKAAGDSSSDAVLETVIEYAEKVKLATTDEETDTAKKDGIEAIMSAKYPSYSLKAVYNTSNDANTLTFYFDTDDHTGDGITVYALSSDASKAADWAYNDIRGDVKKVVIDSSFSDYTAMSSIAYMFYGMTNATEITGTENIDTSNVTNMDYTFCSFGGALDEFNSVPDVSNWDTKSVKSMKNMFANYGADSLTLTSTPSVSSWDVSNLEDMTGLFKGYGKASLKLNFELNLTKWSIAEVQSAGNVFDNAAESVGSPNWNVKIPTKTGKTENTESKWFYDDGNKSISPASNREFTLNVQPKNYTFKAVYDTTGGKNTLTFYYDYKDHSGAGITVYEDAVGAENKLYPEDTEYVYADEWGYKDIRESVKSVIIDSSVDDYKDFKCAAYMFCNMDRAESISGAEYLDTSNITSMSYMFEKFGHSNYTTTCTAPNVSNWDTSKVTDIAYIFDKYGYNVSDVPDVSHWDTSNVKNMSNAFNNYASGSNLTTFPEVSNWNTSKVTDISHLFESYGGDGFKNNLVLDLSLWDLSKVGKWGADYAFNHLCGYYSEPAVIKIPEYTNGRKNEEYKWYYGNSGSYIELSSSNYNQDIKFELPGAISVTYYDQGGSTFTGVHEPGYPRTWNQNTTVQLKKATKPGYDFIGWFSNKNCTGYPVTNISTGSPWGVELYAKWEKQKTISEVLDMADDFPISEEWNDISKFAWKDTGGNRISCYESFDDTVSSTKPNVLVLFKDATLLDSGFYCWIRLNAKVSKTTNGYEFEDRNLKAFFTVNGGKLKSIKVEGKSEEYEPGNGTYEFPAELTELFNAIKGALIAISSEADELIASADSFAATSADAKRKLETAINAIKTSADAEINSANVGEMDKIASAESLTLVKFDAVRELIETADEIGDTPTDKILEIVIKATENIKDAVTEEAVDAIKKQALIDLKQAIYSDYTLKAVYTSENASNTLTFYFDKKDHEGEGDVYTIPTSADSADDWGYNDIRDKVKKVVIDKSLSNYDTFTSTAYMFYDMTNATEISGAANLDVSGVTNMNYMFCSFGSELAGFNSVPDVSNWNTASAESMKNMFANYGAGSSMLTDTPNVSDWNVSNVSNLAGMFNGYGKNSKELNFEMNLSNWNVSKVDEAKDMFKLAGISISKSKWKITIPTNNGDTANEPGKWYYGNETAVITPATGKEFIVNGVLPQNKIFKAVYDKTNDANVLTFYYDNEEHNGDNITVFEDTSASPMFNGSETWKYSNVLQSIKSVVIDESMSAYHGLTSTHSMFRGMSYANSIQGTEYLDVSNVTDMSFMFGEFGVYRTSISDVPDVSNWDTSNVTTMERMFVQYANLSETFNAVPDVSNWDTSNVTSMEGMFNDYAANSQELALVPNVRNWDTSEVVSMTDMFNGYGGSALAISSAPDVSKWDTSNVTSMERIFANYAKSSSAISSAPDVSNWDTSKVTDMSGMFNSYAGSSQVLSSVPDVSKWNTSSVTNMSSMFQSYGRSSESLETVPNVSNWDISSVSDLRWLFQGYGREGIQFTLDLTSWNLQSVSEVEGMFAQMCGGSGGDSIIKIPQKTGDNDNSETQWYYGTSGGYIEISFGNSFVFEPAGTYSITYKDQGNIDFTGNHDGAYPKTFAEGVKTSLKGAKKTGYDFLGWYTNPNCEGNPISEIGEDTYDDVTLYAKWEKQKSIADVLDMAESFPSSDAWEVKPDDAWEDSANGVKCYESFDDTVTSKKPNVLVLINDSFYCWVRLSTNVSRTENGYKFEDRNLDIIFTVESDKLTSIKVEGKNEDYKQAGGTYTAPTEEGELTYTSSVNDGVVAWLLGDDESAPAYNVTTIQNGTTYKMVNLFGNANPAYNNIDDLASYQATDIEIDASDPNNVKIAKQNIG